MKVVLTQDVPKLGRKGEVINVSDGYARNFLIPRGLAKEATEEVLRKLQEERELNASDWRNKEEKAKRCFPSSRDTFSKYTRRPVRVVNSLAHSRQVILPRKCPKLLGSKSTKSGLR